MGKMKKFRKEQRSTWRYYWAHWMSFQMVAITLGIWKFKYLFHDWYKPWLKMFGVDYKAIQGYHRTHSRHHIEYAVVHHGVHNTDWDAMIIDWECSQYTKEACPGGARYEMCNMIVSEDVDEYTKYLLRTYMAPRLDTLGL